MDHDRRLSETDFGPTRWGQITVCGAFDRLRSLYGWVVTALT